MPLDKLNILNNKYELALNLYDPTISSFNYIFHFYDFLVNKDFKNICVYGTSNCNLIKHPLKVQFYDSNQVYVI